ncbi:MAG: cytochrome c oxidase subunit 3 [Rhodomicrobiaceae bacterium]
MSVFRHLTEKPWLAPSTVAGLAPAGGAVPSRRAPDVGLNFFFAVVSVLFFMLIVAYAGRMAFEDWRPAPPPSLLWQNTIVLILASVAMEWARYSAVRDRLDGVKLGLFAGGILTAAFMTGQVIAWRELNAMTAFDATNPAVAFFYMITGLHAAHIAGGLVAWVRVLNRLWRGAETGAIRHGVELCTRYWHFLLIVWLVLFGLLFSGNDNLNILLTICGIR